MRADRTAVRGYLLGELSDERSKTLEHAVLVDREAEELVEEVERDLIDDYVDGRLSAADRVQFERHYLASDVHRDRVSVARALLAHAREVSPADAAGAWPRWGWAAAAVLAIASALALGWWRSGTPDAQTAPSIAVAPSAPTAPPVPAPSDDRARSAEPGTTSTRVALVLPAIATRDRSAETPHVIVSQSVGFVDLLLEGSAAALANARVEVRSVDDRLVWNGTSTPPSPGRAGVAHAAEVSIPADRLAPDDYIVTLTDRNARVVARYFFRVSVQR